jgi:hypothetical protein
MNDAASYQSYLDELVAFATPETRKEELVAARKEFFERTGEIFEDDKQFEPRMAGLLEYFIFDRPREAGLTPAAEFYARALAEGPPERATAFRAFTQTVHGLFEVRKLAQGWVVLRELFTGLDFQVTERRQLAGLTKGDVLEARLIPFGGDFWFSAAFCWHPRAAVPSILKEVKRRKKKGPALPAEFLDDCARRALKADRYRNIAIEKIYEFTA